MPYHAPSPQLPPFGHSFIAIEGNIGAGKTTLCQMLAERYAVSLVLEQFTDNPFLPFFYQQPERYAFPVELFFMTERHKQLQEHFAQPSLFARQSIADYFLVKTLLFAKNNLNEEEFRLFQRLFGVLNATFPRPDLLVYLHRPIEVILRQIAQRGRDMEQSIAVSYLEELQSAYFDYFRTVSDTPVLILDLQDHDFQRNPAVFEQIVGIISKTYTPGLHQMGISP